jgi:hypothetical protein
MTVHIDDVVDVLLGQHDRLRQRFSLLRAVSGRDKKALFDELVRLAHIHEVGEQAVVYQALRDTVAGGTTIAVACAREGAQIVRGLAELRDLGVGHPTFDTTLAAVHQAFLDHAAHEERDEFPRLRQYLPKQSLYTMANELRDVQAMG